MVHNVCWQLELPAAQEDLLYAAFETWWKHLCAGMDADGDGRISEEEFVTAFTEFFTAATDSTADAALLGRA